ncbi:MAG: FAD-binding protein [Polyangiaceae bacterium]|nr:FAD-binding protein [Polyangiaceae bacterium]
MSAWLADLASQLPEGAVVSDRDVLESYARDHARLVPAGEAAALVRARSVEQVIATLRFAHERRIPVVTRGAGTGLSGGANALDGCIQLSVADMRRILRVDPVGRSATVEPGVLNGELAAEALGYGLFYAPDPASREISSIGGNIATNAGGACCLKYGVTGDHVLALKAVLADGTLIRVGSLAQKNVAGLDLKRLLVGSEGTLAVIVEATLRLLPKPRPASTLVAYFQSLQSAGAAIEAMQSLDLSLIEIMDRTTLSAVERHAQLELDTTAAAMVLVQSDASDAPAEVSRCAALCEQHRAYDVMQSSDAEEGRLLLRARSLAYPALERLGATLLDDVAVPRQNLTEMLVRCEAISEATGLTIGTFGHAGDGNLHPTIVFDGQSPESERRAYDAFNQILHEAIKVGGSITGEHGVGALKVLQLPRMIGSSERALMARIKQAFDPLGILNPGRGL